ncbi:hypothetical protein OIU84_028177 [Salix udensis]|uniref:Uncharacterized protein n=1 Tax=Salix udensis TaxID=889485 RepID=A0AAD6P897_9ROSI|nr:hypothetical protein OIU84_028177 [Salix udensis]
MAGIKSAVFLMLITFLVSSAIAQSPASSPATSPSKSPSKASAPAPATVRATGIGAFSFENSTAHRRCTIPRHDHLSSFSSSTDQLFPSWWCPNFYYL